MGKWRDTTAWAITEETQTFPYNGVRSFDDVRECVGVFQDQESIYLPLIEDYVAKNKRKHVLERKFDLPQYSLVSPTKHRTGARPNIRDGLLKLSKQT